MQNGKLRKSSSAVVAAAAAATAVSTSNDAVLYASVVQPNDFAGSTTNEYEVGQPKQVVYASLERPVNVKM
jgi:outer membrane protein assembly factor BamE (lipoprotein component of BamABCDE complex)